MTDNTDSPVAIAAEPENTIEANAPEVHEHDIHFHGSHDHGSNDHGSHVHGGHAEEEEYELAHHDAPIDDLFLHIRNAFVIAAAIPFILSMLSSEYRSALCCAGYVLGFGAYFFEILVLTQSFKRKLPVSEMILPCVFGLLYIALGISYGIRALSH